MSGAAASGTTAHRRMAAAEGMAAEMAAQVQQQAEDQALLQVRGISLKYCCRFLHVRGFKCRFPRSEGKRADQIHIPVIPYSCFCFLCLSGLLCAIRRLCRPPQLL